MLRPVYRRFPVLALLLVLVSVPAAFAGGGGHGFGTHGSYWGGSLGGYGGYSHGMGGYGWGGYRLSGYGGGYGWGGYGWGGYGGYGLGRYGYGPGSAGYPRYGVGAGYESYGGLGYYVNVLGDGAVYTLAPTATDGAAHLDVSVPADATVWFNGTQMVEEKGTNRHFKSPPLADGQNYAYEITAKWVEDGKPVEKSQRVVVRANQHLGVSLTDSAQELAKNIARIQVAVPTAEAKVWLNNAPTESTGVSRRFLSPPLEPGQKYSYELRAQWEENGRPVERSTKVMVQAGKLVIVDLTQGNAFKATVSTR